MNVRFLWLMVSFFSGFTVCVQALDSEHAFAQKISWTQEEQDNALALLKLQVDLLPENFYTICTDKDGNSTYVFNDEVLSDSTIKNSLAWYFEKLFNEEHIHPAIEARVITFLQYEVNQDVKKAFLRFFTCLKSSIEEFDISNVFLTSDRSIESFDEVLYTLHAFTSFVYEMCIQADKKVDAFWAADFVPLVQNCERNDYFLESVNSYVKFVSAGFYLLSFYDKISYISAGCANHRMVILQKCIQNTQPSFVERYFGFAMMSPLEFEEIVSTIPNFETYTKDMDKSQKKEKVRAILNKIGVFCATVLEKVSAV